MGLTDGNVILLSYVSEVECDSTKQIIIKLEESYTVSGYFIKTWFIEVAVH